MLHSKFRNAFAVLLCVVGATITSSSQTERPVHQQNPDKLVVNTGEVLLDVVARDKRGRLVKDLDVSDFEIYEDGTMQQISSFRFVTPKTQERGVLNATRPEQQGRRADLQSPANNTAVKRGGSDYSRVTDTSTVAFVFDRLSPDARARATQAALNYLKETVDQNVLFGVFLTDLSPVILQPFTPDRELVKSGIEKASVHASSLYTSNNEKTRKLRDEATNALLKAQGGGQERSGPGARTTNMLEWLEEMEREQQGDASTRGLLFIASSLRLFTGRKAVIFFSEGLVLPPSVMETFRAVINEGNRNQVSFYPVDAAGLRTESKTLETTKEITSRSDYRMAQLGSSAEPQGPMTKGLERNEDLLRLNPDSGLGQLADQTGGFLITDSNDLKSKLRKVDEDLHAYYLMSYRSNNAIYDGHFRRIEVKLKRPGLNLQSRKGYFAIKDTFASPVLFYEAPALAALEVAPKANSFSFYAGGFSFPERQRTGLVSILADLPLSVFTFHVDQQNKVYATDFTTVVLIRDQEGQVVGKLSNRYSLNGPLESLEARKQGKVLFYRETDLGPGRYKLEVIAYDAPSRRASVRSGTIEVTATDESKLRLSDVVILNRAEPATAGDDEKGSNPFCVANVIVRPNLGEPIHRSLKQMPFLVKIYTPLGGARPKVTVELRKEGLTLAEMPGELLEPDASGRIQYLAVLPLEKIPAGFYELKVTVTDGTASLNRSAFFTIED